MSEKKMVRKSVAITLGTICIILVAGLVGTFAYYMSTVNDRNSTISLLNSQILNLQNQTNVSTEMLNLAKNDVWVNNQTVSQSANSYTRWTFVADFAGYVAITVFKTTANNTYVQVIYSGYGVDYDTQLTAHTGLQVNFPVLPSPLEIRVGNTNAVDNASETVKITYWF
jgi:hypothetical protein